MTELAWQRYENDPDALWAIAYLHREQASRDEANAAWLLAEADEIECYLLRRDK